MIDIKYERDRHDDRVRRRNVHTRYRLQRSEHENRNSTSVKLYTV